VTDKTKIGHNNLYTSINQTHYQIFTIDCPWSIVISDEKSNIYPVTTPAL